MLRLLCMCRFRVNWALLCSLSIQELQHWDLILSLVVWPQMLLQAQPVLSILHHLQFSFLSWILESRWGQGPACHTQYRPQQVRDKRTLLRFIQQYSLETRYILGWIFQLVAISLLKISILNRIIWLMDFFSLGQDLMISHCRKGKTRTSRLRMQISNEVYMWRLAF